MIMDANQKQLVEDVDAALSNISYEQMSATLNTLTALNTETISICGYNIPISVIAAEWSRVTDSKIKLAVPNRNRKDV